MKKKINKKNIIMLLIIILFLILIVIGYSMAKYKTLISGSVSSKVAKPIAELRGEQSLLITAIRPKASYSFEVRNYNDNNQINEVDMEYYIEVISKVNEIVSYKLYDYEKDKEVTLQNNKTNKILLSKEEKEQHKYRLDIEYKKDNSIKSDISDNIEVKIYSVQKV